MTTLVSAAAIIMAVAGHIIHCTTYLKCEPAPRYSVALPQVELRKSMALACSAPESPPTELSVPRQAWKLSGVTPERAAYCATWPPKALTIHVPSRPERPTESGTSMPMPKAANSSPMEILSAALPTIGGITPMPSRRKVMKPAPPVLTISTSRRLLVTSVALGSVSVCATASTARLPGQGMERSLSSALLGKMPMKTPRLAETISHRNICQVVRLKPMSRPKTFCI